MIRGCCSGWLAPLALSVVFAGCAVGGPGSSSGNRGSVDLGLRVAHGTAMQQVGYQVQGNGVSMTGSLHDDDHASGSTFNGSIPGVPAGSGFSFGIVGTTSNGQTCQGSGSIDVGSHHITVATFPLYCNGQLDGFFDHLGHFFQCPILGAAFAWPRHANVGDEIFVAAPYVLFRQVTYAWSTTGGGTFDDPSARLGHYTCTDAGDQTLTVTITDGQGCNKSLSLQVSCGQAPPAPVCGNGVVEAGEQCDDGNTTSGDGCSADCMIEAPAPVCGNGVVEIGEQCDDGNTVSGDGCSADCMIETPSPICGNGVVEIGETCDGNCPTSCNDGDACTIDTMTGSAANCDVQCSTAPVTACTSGDGCCPAGCNSGNDSDCSPSCGNGIVETGEQCDDGNRLNGDGCSATCQTESPTVSFPGTWVADVKTSGTLTVPIVGAQTADLDLLLKLYVTESNGSFDAHIQACRLTTTTTPDATTLVVTYTPTVMESLQVDTSVPAFTAGVGDVVPLPDFTFYSGEDSMGNPVDSDNDGNPGVTVPSSIAGGVITSNVYLKLSIATMIMNPTATSIDTVMGTTSFAVDGEVLGSDNGAVPVGGSITAVPTSSPVPFTSTHLDGNVPCVTLLTMYP